jgi:secondary thiamine-phosphate synthase enzyme
LNPKPINLLIPRCQLQPTTHFTLLNQPRNTIPPSRNPPTNSINHQLQLQSAEMSWFQKTFTLPTRSRGSYLITDEVLSQLPEIRNYKVGMLNLFVQHTSCALSLNENWDEDVRADMSDALDRIAPADRKGNLYRHSAEGEDDMPVCFFMLFVASVVCELRCRGGEWGLMNGAGSYQVRPCRRVGQYSHLEWEVGNGYVAGDLVPGVSDQSAHAQGCCDNSG